MRSMRLTGPQRADLSLRRQAKAVRPDRQKSKRCQCCGQYGYAIESHHTRGRAEDSDRLDVCVDCHLRCCHDGNWHNLPIKPRVCRIMGRKSYWRA